jgi:serine/threonine-protein kinase RsbW
MMGEIQRLEVAGKYSEIRSVCSFVAEGAKDSGLDESAVFHVELACDEACSNIIEHGYGAEGAGPIEVSWQVEGNLFRITIRDNGRAFKPEDIQEPAIDLGPVAGVAEKDLKVGGLGIHFMRKLMDEVHFHSDQDKGNTLIMVKRIPA